MPDALETHWLEPISYELESRTPRRIGVIALATDFTIERDFRDVLGPLTGVDLFTTRIAVDARITRDTLAAMEDRIAPAADLLLPGAEIDVVAYGCTSASTVIGVDRIEELIGSVKPGAAVTTPVSAAFAAFRALDAKRIGVVSPYTHDVNVRVAGCFEAGGFAVPVLGTFDQPDDPTVAEITGESIRHAASLVMAAGADLDALFISCTNLQAMAEVERLERALNLPVTSSNHAMIWHSLRLAGISALLPGLGRLYQQA